jgi:hypothetical protein
LEQQQWENFGPQQILAILDSFMVKICENDENGDE